MTKRTATTAAIILSLAAAGAPVASAKPAYPPTVKPASIYDRNDRQMIPLTAQTTASTITSVPPIAPRAPGVAAVATPQAGFDWGQAGIGAAAGFALAILGIGGAIMISQRRTRRSRHTTAVTS